MRKQSIGRLWSRYLKDRDRLGVSGKGEAETATLSEQERRANQLRDRLVVNYSPLVKYAAGRVGARMTGALDQEDLMSWGVLGLLDAIETFDPGRNAKFESYAISKIRWAILDELRRQDWVPRRVRGRAQEVERATVRLAQDLRRPPTEAEVAREADLTVAEYREFLSQYSRAHVGSLEARLEIDGGIVAEYGSLLEDHGADDPQSEANRADLRAQLVGALENLGEQERLVATFYFYDGLTLKEIGKALNLTEGRISQILRRALNQLRGWLTDIPLISDGF
ncbi:MAG: FliA/WhiG family RNA polymerase sigma factor [Actinomycetota bacterium]|nr:FliA/WhiG family RNA polymerase sigma factor [Actinomycetota bacterium]